VDIPHAMHASLQTAKGALIRAVRDECGGVLIKFPSATSNSDKVLLKGPEDDIELAKRLLLDLANDTVNSRAFLHVSYCLYIYIYIVGAAASQCFCYYNISFNVSVNVQTLVIIWLRFIAHRVLV